MFFKGFFAIFTGLMKVGEMVSEAYYLTHSQYAAEWIYWVNLSLMIGPTILILLFLTFWGLCSLKSSKDCLNHVVLSFFILTHPLGIANFFFGFYLFSLKNPKNKKQLTLEEVKQKEHLRTISYFSRNCKFAECILQSIPQTALKSYNNYLIKSWNLLGIITVVFSIASALFAIIQTVIMLDKESRAIKKQATRTDIMKMNNSDIMRMDKSNSSIYENHQFVN